MFRYKPATWARQDRIPEHLLKTTDGDYVDMRERVYTRRLAVKKGGQILRVVFEGEAYQNQIVTPAGNKGKSLLKARGGVYFNTDTIEVIEDPKFQKESRRTCLEWWRDF